ncbi:hypothetical protein BHE74_00058965 [Ensete ventricosum]|nr:hypothetical protein BHE74_00058965 [Ensete ventricosum]
MLSLIFGCVVSVFNVTDRNGNKVRDKEIISCIQNSLGSEACFSPRIENSVDTVPSKEHTFIEMTGTDRPGLLSEICAVLANRNCSVGKAELWTHNTRVAAVVHVTEESTGGAVDDPERLSAIKELLCNVLRGDNDWRMGRMTVSKDRTHTERRLHQMMFGDRDYESTVVGAGDGKPRPQVAVMDCAEKDYSVVILRSRDRPKLLFDAVCTLTDMQYVVFHGTVDTRDDEAYQLVLRTEDRRGLLSDVTRVFREKGLTIRRAEISRQGGKASDTFYLSEVSGKPVEAKTIESVRRQLGEMVVRVKQSPFLPPEVAGATSFLFGHLFKASLQSFRLGWSGPTPDRLVQRKI